MLCNAHRAADIDLDREVGELLRKEEKLIGAMRYVRICYRSFFAISTPVSSNSYQLPLVITIITQRCSSPPPYSRPHTHTHTHTHTNTHPPSHKRTYTHIHTCAYTLSLTYTHTNIPHTKIDMSREAKLKTANAQTERTSAAAGVKQIQNLRAATTTERTGLERKLSGEEILIERLRAQLHEVSRLY